MQKKNFRIALLPTIVALLCSCSEFDQYTTVGTDVVEESDPSFTKFEENFHPFFLDSSVIEESFSIPQNPDHHFRYTNLLAAGSDSGLKAVAFLTFTLPAEWALALISDTTAEIDSVVFSFFTPKNTADNSALPEISLYRSYPESDEELLVTCSSNDDNDTMHIFSGVYSDSTFIDSLTTFCTDYQKCMDKCDKDDCEAYCDTVDRSFTVTAAVEDSTLYSFILPPLLIIFSHRVTDDTSGTKKDTSTQIDTIGGMTYSVIHESDALISSLSGIPVSKRKSKRTAVFVLNLEDLWQQSSETGFSEILSAVVSFPKETMKITGADSSAIQVRYLLSDRKMSDYSEPDAYFSDTLLYYSGIKTFNSADSDTVHFPINHFLYKYREEQPTELTFYLQIEPSFTKDNIEIIWSKPSFKAVLTSLK